MKHIPAGLVQHFTAKFPVIITVKFLNFWMAEIFAVIYLKFKQRGKFLEYFVTIDPNGMVYSENPYQTAPLGLPMSPKT